MNLPVSKTQIAALVPHAGTMCLIDEVTHWSNKKINCVAHLSPQNHHPLMLDGELSSIHLLEYGAQAMAVHAGLLQYNEINKNMSDRPVPGFLAAIRDAQFFIDSLDGHECTLLISATALVHSAHGVVYKLIITNNQQTLLAQARTTVIHIKKWTTR